MNRTTAPGSVAGAYVDDDPNVPIQGTLLTAKDRNAIQNELIHIIETAGLTPAAGDLTQVRQAIQIIRDAMAAATVLAKLLTVDGAGSGLDADMVDGLQASQLARLDAIPTFAGGITGAEGGEIRLALPPFGSSLSGVLVLDLQTNSFRIFENSGDFRGVYIDLTTAAANAASKIWHSGNDGSGSGLDADTVDGVQAANIVHGDTFAVVEGGSGNINAIGKSGWYRFAFNAGNNPFGHLCIVLHNMSSSDRGYQIAFDLEFWGIKTRAILGGGYTAWTDVWNGSNDGAGSGLDADTVDGYQFTDIAINGGLVTAGDCNLSTRTGTFRWATGPHTNGPAGWTDFMLLVVSNSQDTNYVSQVAFNVSTNDIQTRNRHAGVWSNWRSISVGIPIKYEGAGVTQNEIFDSLVIPSNLSLDTMNGRVIATGSVYTGVATIIVSYFERTAANTITLYGINPATGVLANFTVTNGGAGSYNISVGWEQ